MSGGKTRRVHRWSGTLRDGRRFTSTSWKFVANYQLLDETTGKVVCVRTERGHARTQRAARRAIAKVLAS